MNCCKESINISNKQPLNSKMKECGKQKLLITQEHEEPVKREEMMEMRGGEWEGKPGKRIKEEGEDEKVEKGQT